MMCLKINVMKIKIVEGTIETRRTLSGWNLFTKCQDEKTLFYFKFIEERFIESAFSVSTFIHLLLD